LRFGRRVSEVEGLSEEVRAVWGGIVVPKDIAAYRRRKRRRKRKDGKNAPGDQRKESEKRRKYIERMKEEKGDEARKRKN
jgi:hypothetical protein